MRSTLAALTVLALVSAPGPADACRCSTGQLIFPRAGLGPGQEETTSTSPVFVYLARVPYHEQVEAQLHDGSGAVVPVSIERRVPPRGGQALILVRPMVPLAPRATYTLEVGPPGLISTAELHTADGPDAAPPPPVEGLVAKAFGALLPETQLGLCSTFPESYDYDILSLDFQPLSDDGRLVIVALRHPDEVVPFDVFYLDPDYAFGDSRLFSNSLCGPRPPHLADGESVCVGVSSLDGAGNLSAPREVCVTKERTCSPDPDHGVVCPWAVAPPIVEQDSGCSVTNVAGTHSPASWLGIALALLVLRRRRPQ